MPKKLTGGKKPKEARISVKIDDVFKGRIDAVVEKVGVNEAALTRALWDALANSVERLGTVTLPLAIVSRVDQERVLKTLAQR